MLRTVSQSFNERLLIFKNETFFRTLLRFEVCFYFLFIYLFIFAEGKEDAVYMMIAKITKV